MGIKRVKVFGHLSCVFIMMTAGCIHHGSKNDALNESSQKDLSEQEITDGTVTWNVEFSEDFSGVDVDAEPESIFILDGEYTVKKMVIINAFHYPEVLWEILGYSLDRGKGKTLELSFSFYASKKGRRMPSIAASIGGVRGYKLRLNPAARNLVLSMDETVFKEVPFSWKGSSGGRFAFRHLRETESNDPFAM